MFLQTLKPFQNIDLSNENIIFTRFLQVREKESVAIEAPSAELEKFRHIESLSNYTLLNFVHQKTIGYQ
jgi:hypothetical protein